MIWFYKMVHRSELLIYKMSIYIQRTPVVDHTMRRNGQTQPVICIYIFNRYKRQKNE